MYITERLQANGYETYIVGGAVRDLILGKKPKDFDIVTAASPVKIKKIFRNARIIGRRFRLVHVFFGLKIFEVSTFRSLKDGPTSNTFGTIEEDVLRRDFSLNALFYDPLKQLVVDYVGGMDDIRKRLIRPIIALPHIFTDDPVRMIRAVKYSAVADFKLPLSLKWRIRKHSGLLAGISPSRLTEEIFKIIHSPHARTIVENLDALGLYCYLQPQAAGLFKTMPAFKARYMNTIGTLCNDGSRNSSAQQSAADFKDPSSPVRACPPLGPRIDDPRRAGEARPPSGETLSALVRDYLEDTADWDGKRDIPAFDGSPESPESGTDTKDSPRPLAERYKSAFTLARQFVLPMNPPRVELDAALRLLFAEHGVPIKKMRLNDRRPRMPKLTVAGKGGETGKYAATTKKPDANKPAGAENGRGSETPGESAPNKRRRRRKKRTNGE